MKFSEMLKCWTVRLSGFTEMTSQAIIWGKQCCNVAKRRWLTWNWWFRFTTFWRLYFSVWLAAFAPNAIGTATVNFYISKRGYFLRHSKQSRAAAISSSTIFYSANSNVGIIDKSKMKNPAATVTFTAKVTGISKGGRKVYTLPTAKKFRWSVLATTGDWYCAMLL